MSTTIIAGIFLIHLALIFYTIFVIAEYRRRRVDNLVMSTISTAVIMDIIATISMAVEAGGVHFNLHGAVGYTGVLIMIVNAGMVWRVRIQNGKDAELKPAFIRYTLIAYAVWLIAFVTGVIISMGD